MGVGQKSIEVSGLASALEHACSSSLLEHSRRYVKEHFPPPLQGFPGCKASRSWTTRLCDLLIENLAHSTFWKNRVKARNQNSYLRSCYGVNFKAIRCPVPEMQLEMHTAYAELLSCNCNLHDWAIDSCDEWAWLRRFNEWCSWVYYSRDNVLKSDCYCQLSGSAVEVTVWTQGGRTRSRASSLCMT